MISIYNNNNIHVVQLQRQQRLLSVFIVVVVYCMCYLSIIFVVQPVSGFTTISTTSRSRSYYDNINIHHPIQSLSFLPRQSYYSMIQPLYANSDSTTSSSSTTKNKKKATLLSDTTWRIRIVLRNIMTEKKKKVNEIFIITGQFIEEDGFEPPQGTFCQQLNQQKFKVLDTTSTITTTTTTTDDDATTNTTTSTTIPSSTLSIINSRWQLSEDPNDRKDGLWIWGLFKEPLYPYMLFQFQTDTVSISGNTDTIPPLQLYAQLFHQRDKELGVVLDNRNINAANNNNNNGNNGALLPVELKIRQFETIKADPFGVSKVDVYEEVSIGTISITSDN